MADLANTTTTRQPNPLPTILLAFLGFGIFGGLILLVYPIGTPEDLAAKRAAERLEIRSTVDVRQAKLVSDSVGFADPEATMLHLPQADVMESVIKELSAKQVGPSTMKVDPAAAAVDGGNAATPVAPTATPDASATTNPDTSASVPAAPLSVTVESTPAPVGSAVESTTPATTNSPAEANTTVGQPTPAP